VPPDAACAASDGFLLCSCQRDLVGFRAAHRTIRIRQVNVVLLYQA
jgi:hypothetical protein